jgi:acetyl-CoA carboxylase biotin carboxyl carrier protein
VSENGDRVSWDRVLELVTRLDESGLAEASVSFGDVTVQVSRSGPLSAASGSAGPAPSAPVAEPAAPAPTAPAAAPAAAPAPAPAPAGTPVPAPMVGVFYRAPSPGADPFVAEGQRVEAEQTIGILEVMKMMNPVVAGVAGTVVSFAVNDAEAVEFGQTLAYVEESA